jgi:copper transport protein
VLVPVVRRIVCLLALLAGTLVTGLVTAAPAAAHAELVSSDPATAARLDAAPRALSLVFTEDVTLVRGGIRLLDARGKAVPTGAPRTEGPEVTVPVRGVLPEGAYVFVWRVVSADSHPVQGAVPFAVGDATPVAADTVKTESRGGRAALAVARWVGFAGLALLVGVAAFVLLCWPAGAAEDLVRRLVVGGGGLLLGSSLVSLLAQGPYVAGTPLTSAFDTALVSATLATPFGEASAFRFVAVLGLLLLLQGLRRRVTAGSLGGAVALTVWVLATYAAQGHAFAARDRPVAMAADAAHLAAMAVWIGGLVVLCVRVLRDGAVRDPEPVLTRWTRVATWSVAVLVVTGTYQALREVGGLDPLVGSTYGRLLLVKLAFFVAMLGLGNAGRVWIRRRYLMPVVQAYDVKDRPVPRGAAPAELGRLRRSVAAEAALAVLVLAVTAVLVGTTPGRSAVPAQAAAAAAGAAAPAPRAALGTATLPDGSKVDIGITAQRKVLVRLRDKAGQPLDPAQLTVTASLPARGLERLALPTRRVDGGVYAAGTDPLPFAGTWRVTVTVRTSDVDAGVGTVSLTIA